MNYRFEQIRLNNGVEIPQLGLGVWKCPGKTAYEAVKMALDVGYRHIDTAKIYGNEREVGQAIRDSKIPRDEIFVTTKLWTADHGYDSALRAFDESLTLLGIDYVDLYLSHFPVTGKRTDAWRALEEISKNGKCRAIGVSNYTVRHLEEILGVAKVVPTINQVEFHPFLYQRELLEFCHKNKIRIEAYSPLTHGQKLNDPTVTKVAKKHSVSAAQVLIRWCMDKETVVIPKSTRRERLEENWNSNQLKLDSADIEMLDQLNENLRTCWDPSETP